MNLPTMADVRAAAQRIAPDVRRTPLHPWEDGQILLKLENLQPTGSFKVRGAANHLRAVAGSVRGVVTASSGNHGQAVAYVAHRMGMPAVVVVPETVNPLKAARIVGFGAELIRCGTSMPERTTLAGRLAEERDLHLVPSFDDAFVVAGQGTCGLELAEQASDLAAVVIPTGGGGLISGVALVMKALRPQVRIIGVEPRLLPRFAASRAAGARVTVPFGDTIADGLRGQQPGVLTWEVTSSVVDEFVAVDDEETLDAVRRLFLEGHLVVEPSGAVGVAAIFAGIVKDRPVAAVISGGNLDLALLPTLFSKAS